MFTGIFSMFGRSRELQQFDRELRDAGLHPTLVPEPVKLTALKLLNPRVLLAAVALFGEIGPVTEVASAHASLLLAYCILGRSDFEAVNDATLVNTVEARVVVALGTEDGLDARLVLLALHSRVIDPSVIEYFGLEVE